jgi:Ca-activated chloride channel family protein
MKLSRQSRIANVILALFIAMMMCFPPFDTADEREYTIRSSVDEVRLAFAASDRQGRIVKTLRPSDVAVVDNGLIIRRFRSFRAASEAPLYLVILLDASDSVESQIPKEIAEVKRFVESSAWGDRDKVSILAFGGLRPTLVCARNCNTQIARVRLDTLRANGATPLYDALFEATEILKENRDPESRPSMILFSDGVDTISMHNLPDALEAAQNLQAAIYCINSAPKKSVPERGEAVLEYLAMNSGGLSYPPKQNMSDVLRSILEDLRSGYVLTYGLPGQNIGLHSVRILPMSDPGLRFRSRQAYNDIGDE